MLDGEFSSQSPQIGSYLRLDTETHESFRRLLGLNPLKSGPTFGSTARKEKASGNKVSIPSNRVLPSVQEVRGSYLVAAMRLNPLKSGPTFGLGIFGKRKAKI